MYQFKNNYYHRHQHHSMLSNARVIRLHLVLKGRLVNFILILTSVWFCFCMGVIPEYLYIDSDLSKTSMYASTNITVLLCNVSYMYVVQKLRNISTNSLDSMSILFTIQFGYCIDINYYWLYVFVCSYFGWPRVAAF